MPTVMFAYMVDTVYVCITCCVEGGLVVCALRPLALVCLCVGPWTFLYIESDS